jgi:hypothetical protein
MTRPGPFESRTYPIAEDMPAQLVTWRVQRVGWIGFALVCLAALLGAFGDGFLARAEVVDPTGRLRIEYDRIDRRDAPSILRISAGNLPPGGEAIVRYGRGFVDKRSLRAVDPAPLRAAGDAAGLVHTYAVPPSGSIEVLVEYRPRELGASTARIGLAGGPELTIAQFVLP